jgi:hypothetical protein
LYDWVSENNLSLEYKKRIYLSFKSFDLSQKKGWAKYSNILWEGLKNPEILKTKYRFNYYR